MECSTAYLPRCIYHHGMLRPWSIAQLGAELGALEASAERARAALACAYATSAEFEAAVIRARREAGMFDPWYIARLRMMLALTIVVAAIAVVAIVF